MAKHPPKAADFVWQDLTLSYLVVQPNWKGTGTHAILARFAFIQDARAVQHCFWRKHLQIWDARTKAELMEAPNRRRKRAGRSSRERRASSTD